MLFKRYQLDEKNQPINIFTGKIDWIMGSGNHFMVYIYQTEEGELYQLPLAWYHLGNAQVKLNLHQEAIQSYKRALEINPTDTNIYLAIGRIFFETGNRAEAFRYWRHGIRTAANPALIVKILSQYEKSE